MESRQSQLNHPLRPTDPKLAELRPENPISVGRECGALNNEVNYATAPKVEQKFESKLAVSAERAAERAV